MNNSEIVKTVLKDNQIRDSNNYSTMNIINAIIQAIELTKKETIEKLEKLKYDIVSHPDYTVEPPTRWDLGVTHGIEIATQKIKGTNKK